MSPVGDMTQLVRIARGVDRGDPAAVDLERRGLQDVAGLDSYEPRQAIDEAEAQMRDIVFA
jgi:hypothetical protein